MLSLYYTSDGRGMAKRRVLPTTRRSFFLPLVFASPLPKEFVQLQKLLRDKVGMGRNSTRQHNILAGQVIAFDERMH